MLGFVGQFFAGLIKAAVSRQREWLADASSVQFTRQTSGLVGALKKIAGIPAGSALNDTAAERQVSHMLFGEGKRVVHASCARPTRRCSSASRPSTRAFRADEMAALAQQYAAAPPNGLAEDARSGWSGRLPPPPTPHRRDASSPPRSAARVGTFTPADLERGAALSAQIPATCGSSRRQPSTAVPLVLALLLDADPRCARPQAGADRPARVGRRTASAARRSSPRVVDSVPQLLRLPLARDRACRTSTARPRAQLDALLAVLDELARADGTLTVFEYCLTRLVGVVRVGLDSTRCAARGPGRASAPQVQDAALTLLAVVAAAGNADPAAAHGLRRRRRRGSAWPRRPYAPPADFVAALDAVWQPLDALDPRYKRPLIEALVAAIADDGVLAVPEAELLRTACALLHCPLPALLA